MNIIEDEFTGELIINDKKLTGFILEDRFCDKCRNKWIYYEKYDAFFCAYCNTWLEQKCSDSHCDYCRNRPDKPL